MREIADVHAQIALLNKAPIGHKERARKMGELHERLEHLEKQL